MSPFRGGHTITQRYKERPEYYTQFGLRGHEGIDLVPKSGSWEILSLEDGIVVRDEDRPIGSYGIFTTVWHPKIKKATQYAHMDYNVVQVGQEVKKGQFLGEMGATGNTQGVHLHLNLFDVDDNGIRLNRDNGYLGGIDPEPFLKEGDGMTMYKGYDLDNKESMKVAVDVLVRVQNGEFNTNPQLEKENKLAKEKYQNIKRAVEQNAI